MRRLTGGILSLLIVISGINAQNTPINPVYDFSYYISGEGGANGLTVAYNTKNNYYYCIQAGNADFPMEIFDASGSMIHSTTAKVDARGFWYNPKNNTFEGTKFVSGAYVMYINDQGIPSNPVTLANGAAFVPPVDQSQVVSNLKRKELYAYNEGFIHIYSQQNYELKKKMPIQQCPVELAYLNPYAMFYTGKKNFEFGLYDIVNAQILFFNAKGIYTKAIKMPSDTPVIEVFRLGFANNRIFIYDGDYRAWYCYRIFADGSET